MMSHNKISIDHFVKNIVHRLILNREILEPQRSLAEEELKKAMHKEVKKKMTRLAKLSLEDRYKCLN